MVDPAKSAVALTEKLALFQEHWSPRTVAEFNGHDIMVAKIQGAFPWHAHDDTDDFFLVLKGSIRIELRSETGSERSVELGQGELFVVPKGVEHRPVADAEAHIMLIERTGTPNSGDPATAAPRIVV
ncbi:MAG: cupin domain-containing protein [Pseudomonadota bacterium]